MKSMANFPLQQQEEEAVGCKFQDGWGSERSWAQAWRSNLLSLQKNHFLVEGQII